LKIETIEIGVLWGEPPGSASGSATPLERKIWEDVLSAASCEEAVPLVEVGCSETTVMAGSSFVGM
jgi:hypothetical protein